MREGSLTPPVDMAGVPHGPRRTAPAPRQAPDRDRRLELPACQEGHLRRDRHSCFQGAS